LGFEQFYPSNTVLLLKKTLYGLKQATIAFYRKFLVATKNIGLTRSTANQWLYYKWERGNLVIKILSIDNNMILDPEDLVMQVKADLMKQFECDNCGQLEEYVGNKINYVDRDAIRFVQTVLIQSHSDKFNLKEKCHSPPAIPGTVLKKPA
jgi:hypothetical protein